jgi:hypothetical protein
MTSPGYEPNILPNLSIVGPEIAHRSARHRDPLAKAELCPLWRLSCAALYFRPPDPSHAADKSPGLRTLLENSRGLPISTIDTLEGQNRAIGIEDYREPALIAAVVTLGGGADGKYGNKSTNKLDLFGEYPGEVCSRHNELDRDGNDPADPGTQHHVLLAPAKPWPDQPPKQGDANGVQLWVPPMRLVAGRIPLLLELSEELMLTLRGNFEKGTLFGNHLSAGLKKGKPLAADLTPHGIEFQLGLPDPVADLVAAQPQTSPPARQRARLQPVRGVDSAEQTQLGLALVDTADDGRMDQAFARAFAQLRRDGSPLRVDYDPRPQVAPLWWPLLTQRVTQRNDPNFERPVLTFPDNLDNWTAEMRGDVFRMRLITGRAEGTFTDAVARANIADDATLQLVRDEKEGTRLMLDSGGAKDTDPVADALQLEATWTLRSASFALDSASLHGTGEDKSAEVHAGLQEAADRLGARYAARGLLRPGQTRAPHLFIPIVEGVAQIKTPTPEDLRLGRGTNPPLRPGSSLDGAVVLELPRKGDALPVRVEPVRLEIDAVTRHKIAVRWFPRNSNAPGTDVRIWLRGLRGVVRNLLWLAEESPDADRALPTGRIAPAATGPMPLYLGAAMPSDAKLKLDWGVSGNAPSLTWTAELHGGVQNTSNRPEQILWTRHPSLPLISAAEMLRSGDATADPSPTRDLFPSELEGALILYGAPSSLLPSISPSAEAPPQVQVRALWRQRSGATSTKPKWGAPEIPLVAPSAPGLEFRQVLGEEATGFTQGFAFETALRLDLPGLDELFAVAAPPRPARPEVADASASTPQAAVSPTPQAADPPATALDLDLLEEQLWRRREIALAMTRTVAARATKWFDLEGNDPASEIHGLVEPWTAKATVTFQNLWTDQLAGAPLGGWQVEWPAPAIGTAPAPESFTGDMAIAGLGGVKPARFAQEGDALVRRDDDDDDVDAPIKIAGFAAALFPDTEQGCDVDGAGLALQRRAQTSTWPQELGAAATGRAWRTAAVREVGAVYAERRLVTFSTPVKVSLTPGGDELLFWIRDLPLEGGEDAWCFDAAKAGPERALGADPTLLDREHAAAAIYEWRLHKVHKAEGNGWGFGWGGLNFRPLRLLSVTDKDFKTLCSVDLFDTPKASNARFGDDRPYRTGNLVRLDFNWTEAGAQLDAVTRVRLQADANQVSMNTLEKDATPLRFPVDYIHEADDEKSDDEKSDDAGTATRERAVLLIHPEDDGKLLLADGHLKAALQLRLFGSLMQVEGGQLKNEVDETEQAQLDLSFIPTTQEAKLETGYGVTLKTLSLVLRLGEPGSLSMDFSLSVPLPESSGVGDPAVAQDAMLIEHHTDGSLTWLAQENISPADKTTLQVDHARGVLRLSATNKKNPSGTSQDPIKPIRGFVYSAPQYEILLDMVFPLQDDDKSGELPIAFDSPALDASARLIAAEGHVGATLRTELRIEQSKIVAADMMLDLPLDGFEGNVEGWLESGVSWPVAGLKPGDMPTPGRARRFQTEADPEALRHEVCPAVTGWRVPLAALGKVDEFGVKIGVARRIDILARVEHRLTPKSGGEPLPTFFTLDRITLLDASKIKALAEEMLKVEAVGTPRSLPYGFAPRYTDSDLRKLGSAAGQAQKKRTPHAGVARPSIAGGGFRDLKLLEDLKAADGRGGLLVFGAAPLALLPEKPDSSGALSLSFAVPWVTASASAEAPAALKRLQGFSATRGWVASDVDLAPFWFELAPNAGVHGPRLLSDPPQRAADLRAALNLAFSRSPADDDAWTSTEVLEPALFDAEAPGQNANAPVKPLPSKDIPLEDWPLFLRSLVGLQKILQQPDAARSIGRGRVVTLLRPGLRPVDADLQGRLVAVRFVAPAPAVLKSKSDEADRLIKDFFTGGAPAELVVYSANGIRRAAPAPETGVPPGAEAALSAALRDAAEALSSRPRVIVVERRDADGFRLLHDVVAPGREAAELGAGATKLRDREETVYPSSALGWPEKPFGGSDASDLTLDAGPDAPLLSAKAGLSGRVAGFGLRPKAAPKGSPTVWFVSASRTRFLRRRDDSEPFSGVLAAPVPRHMTAPSVRARAPGNAALSAALDKVAGDSAFADSAPIMPAGLLRGAIGRRPGVMEIGYDALMTDRGGGDLLDNEDPQSGVSATLGPAILRILRRPRSTALPRGVDFARRRRTFVSGADLRAGPLRESLVEEGAFVAMRQPEVEGDRRLLVELQTPTVAQVLDNRTPTVAQVLDNRTPTVALVLKNRIVQVRMTLAVENVKNGDASAKIMPFLAETGFFAKVTTDGGNEYASLGAQLVAGDLRIPFSSVKWTKEKEGETLTLSFTLKQPDAEALAERARTEAADLRVALQLSSGVKPRPGTTLSPGTTGIDAYGDGSNVEAKLAPEVGSSNGNRKLPETDDMLELPLLSAPLDRPTLPYAMRTAIFGDPAYDRSLASRPQSDERPRPGKSLDEKEHAFLFGLDRASHDLGAAIHFAAGEVLREKGKPAEWGTDNSCIYELSVQRQPYCPGTTEQPKDTQPLRLAKEGQKDDGAIWYQFEPQLGGKPEQRYAIPVAALYEFSDKDGPLTPASLRPGDRLVLTVRVLLGNVSVVLRAATLLTAEPSISPPEAVYSLLDIADDKKGDLRARVALHAPGPMPRRVEFLNFTEDLLKGHIRRRALFIWHEVDIANLDGTTRHATLLKFDRSGGGQLPQDPSDFQPPLKPPADGGSDALGP